MSGEKGLPRPSKVAKNVYPEGLEGASLPDPWITEEGEFLTFSSERCEEAYHLNLCQVCGESLCPPAIMLGTGNSEGARYSSGPAVHPRCALIALRHCPHFNRVRSLEGWSQPRLPDLDEVVGWAWWGEGRGYSLGLAEEESPFSDEIVVDSEATSVTVAEIRALARGDVCSKDP